MGTSRILHIPQERPVYARDKELGKTCCDLAASGSGSSDDNKRSACLDIIIFP